MITSKKKSRTKKNRKRSDIKIFESWLCGSYENSNLVIPVVNARSRLADCDENDVRSIWDSLYSVFDSWKLKHGQVPISYPGGILTEAFNLLDDETRIHQAEPWKCAGFGVTDPLQLLEYLERIKYPGINKLVSKHGKIKILAVIILHEASIGDGIKKPGIVSDSIWADHVLTAINTERELSLHVLLEYIEYCEDAIEKNVDDKKKREEVLKAGRAIASQKSKEEADVRKMALRFAAIEIFRLDPGCTYDECVERIKSDPSLKESITYKKDSIYSDSVIKKLIKGTKKIAFQNPKK